MIKTKTTYYRSELCIEEELKGALEVFNENKRQLIIDPSNPTLIDNEKFFKIRIKDLQRELARTRAIKKGNK